MHIPANKEYASARIHNSRARQLTGTEPLPVFAVHHEEKQVFDPRPSHGKRQCRILARSGTVSLQQTPRACVADAVNAPSIVQCRLVVSPMLWVGEGIGLSTI